ncbi:MAG: 3-methyl-2-oxobutanoate hydroxymethyltransferase, partial [Nanoarchaeota archaeon]
MKSVIRIIKMKGNEKIAMLTSYDYSTAKILDGVGIDIILVGDSLGMVVLGYDSTRDVTMVDMVRHTKAVANGAKNTLIVSDMPYKSDINSKIAIKNAKILLENGADAVKIEGKPEIAKALVKSNINVMGHVGLLPQSAKNYTLQGRDNISAVEIFNSAVALENAGCFAVVLEAIPPKLGKMITERLNIPTIGIGAGANCDGQVLVINDMLGLYEDFKPRFVKRYCELSVVIKNSVSSYKRDVKQGIFP